MSNSSLSSVFPVCVFVCVCVSHSHFPFVSLSVIKYGYVPSRGMLNGRFLVAANQLFLEQVSKKK